MHHTQVRCLCLETKFEAVEGQQRTFGGGGNVICIRPLYGHLPFVFQSHHLRSLLGTILVLLHLDVLH
jgi:hypothetical protein